jgi:hypothetical protein
MAYIFNNEIKYSDSAILDAFGRLRVSQVTSLLDIKHVTGKNPLTVNEVTNGTATSIFNKENARIRMSTSANNDYVIRQTKGHAIYQAGKGQLFEASFSNFAIETNVIKRVGAFVSSTAATYDTVFDGFFLESNGVTNEISFKINKSGTTTYSSATSDWSSDEYDVNDIDWTKTQLMFVDYQWLGVGRLRFGLNISGQTIYFGESNHANNSDTVYMSNPSQPIRYEIKQFGAGSGYFDMICSQISSEGALNELYFTTALIHSATTTMSTSGQKYPYIGYRLKPDIQGIVSQIDKFSILNTSNDNYFITVEFNPTLSTSVTWIDLPDSPFQYALANGTPTITANGFIIESILGEAGASALTSLEVKNTQIRPNTNIDGTKDEMWVCLTPLGANATFNGTANILYYL